MKKAKKNEVWPKGGDVIGSIGPLIPVELAEPGGSFLPCSQTVEWLRATFLDQESPLYNVEHDHLNSAAIGVLWTNAPNSRHMRQIVGTAELAKPPSSLSKWAKARFEFQKEQWFHPLNVDFIITLYAPYFAGASEIEQYAVVDHELYHCGQQRDVFGLPKFSTKSGKPIFGIRGHDVEEFVGIVRRYGPVGAAGDSAAFIEAAKSKPEIGAAQIAGMCGTCR